MTTTKFLPTTTDPLRMAAILIPFGLAVAGFFAMPRLRISLGSTSGTAPDVGSADLPIACGWLVLASIPACF